MIATTRERVDRLVGLLAREREAMADFIAELAAFDDGREPGGRASAVLPRIAG